LALGQLLAYEPFSSEGKLAYIKLNSAEWEQAVASPPPSKSVSEKGHGLIGRPC